jgi:hypothetical protein
VANTVTIEAKRRRRGGGLCRAGWALFALSLALPAVTDPFAGRLSGWECFRGIMKDAWGSLTGPACISLYWSGFAVANLIMLASPAYTRLFRHDLRWLRRGSLVLGGATLYTATFALSGDVPFSGLGVGYYAWVVSFGLVTAGMRYLSTRRLMHSVEAGLALGTRTPEEAAALRELEDYLHGVVRPQVRANDHLN